MNDIHSASLKARTRPPLYVLNTKQNKNLLVYYSLINFELYVYIYIFVKRCIFICFERRSDE